MYPQCAAQIAGPCSGGDNCKATQRPLYAIQRPDFEKLGAFGEDIPDETFPSQETSRVVRLCRPCPLGNDGRAIHRQNLKPLKGFSTTTM